MIRGVKGVNILGDDKDREQFLSWLGDTGKPRGTRIMAWALMENHVQRRATIVMIVRMSPSPWHRRP